MNRKYIIAIILIVVGLALCYFTYPNINLDDVKDKIEVNIEHKF